MGMAAAAGGCYSTAIMWLLRAKDPGACAQLVEPLLHKIGQEMVAQVGCKWGWWGEGDGGQVGQNGMVVQVGKRRWWGKGVGGLVGLRGCRDK
jgi:hypothetical protein